MLSGECLSLADQLEENKTKIFSFPDSIKALAFCSLSAVPIVQFMPVRHSFSASYVSDRRIG
jgi:hypothetical protein